MNSDRPRIPKSSDEYDVSRQANARRTGVRVVDLTVKYGRQVVLERLSLDLASGDTLVVLGASGCGKTTLLRAIAGAIDITSGSINLDDVDLTDVVPQQRGVIYLDQEPLLFEHLNVAENLAFALSLRGQSREAIDAQVDRMLVELELTGLATKREWQLSGGQKQRVAFGRAILARPKLLLLDEPFCSLDGKTRSLMQELFVRLSHEHGLTSIFVTHDVKEALIVGQAFARMEQGTLLRYANRDAFRLDPATGIPAEIAFWQARSEEGK